MLFLAVTLAVAAVAVVHEEVLVGAVSCKRNCGCSQAGKRTLESIPPREGALRSPSVSKFSLSLVIESPCLVFSPPLLHMKSKSAVWRRLKKGDMPPMNKGDINKERVSRTFAPRGRIVAGQRPL